jgi:hypothetical protein
MCSGHCGGRDQQLCGFVADVVADETITTIGYSVCITPGEASWRFNYPPRTFCIRTSVGISDKE